MIVSGKVEKEMKELIELTVIHLRSFVCIVQGLLRRKYSLLLTLFLVFLVVSPSFLDCQ